MKGWYVLAGLLASCLAERGCPFPDPMNYTVHLPHPTNCSLFYRCDHGAPKLDRCPSILHFNPTLEVCDWPHSAGCTAGQTTTTPTPSCGVPPTSEHGAWSPVACAGTTTPGLGQTCSLSCAEGYELNGRSDITCTADGWLSAKGLNQIPECKELAEIGAEFIRTINKTLNGKQANMMFLLDESFSLTPTQFAMEVLFMKAIVAAFPLGADRGAGAISFQSSSRVLISPAEQDTCSFIRQADSIVYGGGGTNILGALQLAISELQTNAPHNFTLVFLITDGMSYTDPQPAADQIKNANNALFTIGIGHFDPSQLTALASRDEDGVPIFFPIQNFDVFKKVAEYLNTAYNIDFLNALCSVEDSSSTDEAILLQ